jgi:hypothetical protein
LRTAKFRPLPGTSPAPASASAMIPVSFATVPVPSEERFVVAASSLRPPRSRIARTEATLPAKDDSIVAAGVEIMRLRR